MTPAAPKAPFSAVLGLGVTGLSCLRHLHAQGRRLVAMDTRDAPPEVDTVRKELPEVLVITGGFDAAMTLEASLIAVSPGIPAEDPLLQEARARGIDVAGDIELFARAVDAPVVFIQCLRLGRGRYEARFHTVSTPPHPAGDHAITERYIALAERCIREQPETYLWSSRRWRRRPA